MIVMIMIMMVMMMIHLGMYISMLRASSQLPTCSLAHISTGLFVLQMIMKKLKRTMMIMITSPPGCLSCG